MKKYLNALFKEQYFLVYGAMLLILGAVCLVLMIFRCQQGQVLKTAQKEKALVLQIDAMEKKIRSRSFQSANPEFKVQGMISRDGTPRALINSAIYEEGDTFGDYTLLKIKKNVLVFFNNQTYQSEEIIFSEDPAKDGWVPG